MVRIPNPSLRERLGRTKVNSKKVFSSYRALLYHVPGCRFAWLYVGMRCCQLTSDGDSTKTKTLLDLEDVTDGLVGAEAERLGDEAVLVLLDLAHNSSLLDGRHVVVNNTHTAHETNGDGHVGLGDRVHRTGEEGGVEGHVAGDLGLEADLGGGKVDEAGENEKVIVGQTTVGARVDELRHGKTVASLVRLEVGQGLRGVERGSVRSHLDDDDDVKEPVLEEKVCVKKRKGYN